MATDTRCRVKLYSFSENRQWEDMGTGHVTLSYLERLQGLTLVVRSETDGKLFKFDLSVFLSIHLFIHCAIFIYPFFLSFIHRLLYSSIYFLSHRAVFIFY